MAVFFTKQAQFIDIPRSSDAAVKEKIKGKYYSQTLIYVFSCRFVFNFLFSFQLKFSDQTNLNVR